MVDTTTLDRGVVVVLPFVLDLLLDDVVDFLLLLLLLLDEEDDLKKSMDVGECYALLNDEIIRNSEVGNDQN